MQSVTRAVALVHIAYIIVSTIVLAVCKVNPVAYVVSVINFFPAIYLLCSSFKPVKPVLFLTFQYVLFNVSA